MARIKVPFKGVTSQSNHQDGECKNIVNLRPKNGFLKPVPPRKVLQGITWNYDIVFVHRGNNYENWIGVRNISDGTAMIYTDILTGNPLHIGNTPYHINSVQQIGNTLSFVTDYGIYYALYTGSEYTYLGTLPDLPNVRFSVSFSTTNSRRYIDEYNQLPPKAVDDNTHNTLIEMTKGLINVITEDNKNRFSDAFIIRFAFRLYDGSVVKPSPPVLIMHRENYKDLALAYLPDDTNQNYYGTSSEVRLKFFTVDAVFDFRFLSAWKDIITSVDFFVSPYTGLQSSENVHQNFMFKKATSLGSDIYRLYYPSFRSYGDSYEQAPEEKIINAAQFYLYYSETDFSGPKTVSFPNNKTTVGNEFKNVKYQELLESTELSHHKYGSKIGYSYNNRLRLLDVNTVLFGGFPANMFEVKAKFNGFDPPSPATAKQIKMITHIKTDEGTKYVISDGNVSNIFLNPYISYPDPRAFKIEFVTVNPYDSNFPQTLVHEVQLIPHPTLNIAYYLNSNIEPITFPSQNQTLPRFVPPAYPTEYNTLHEHNKIKVSEVNNPFIFPDVNTYLVGSGKILAESSIIMNVSDRNYGMYPVFVFTTDGVFTMAGQDVDTVHASIQAPTYLEPPVSNVICATPYGVVFITNRGLMQINNYKTESLSEVLREDDDILNIDLSGVPDPSVSYPSVSFREFLKSASSIVYNPYNDELIISASGYPYNYVYDYATKSFYLSTNLIDQLVQNTFPDVYYITDNNLIDISQSESKATHVSLLTRPLQFGITDIKKLERIFLRALMYNAENVMVAAYHSMDGVNFSAIKGFAFGSGKNYKDFDFGLLARETYRQYSLMFTGTIDEESQIEYIDIEVDKNYNNEKMR